MTLKATGRRAEIDGFDSLVVPRSFAQDIATVWTALTDPEALTPWIGTWEGDPASGSVTFRMLHEGAEHPGEVFTINSCQAPHHLAMTSVTNGEPPMTWNIVLNLSAEGDGCHLEFAQSVPDPSWGEGMGPGWEYYLDRLVASVNGGDIGAIDFETYQAELTPAYREIFPVDPGASDVPAMPGTSS